MAVIATLAQIAAVDADLSDPPMGSLPADACSELSEALAVLGARRLVVGHTVQPRISCACDCTVFRVDVGLSSAMGSGLPQALEIGVDGTVRVLAARVQATSLTKR